jgi:TatD DNase family protein
MFVDSHCHLAFPEYEGRMSDLRNAMATSNVDAALVICTTLEEFDRVHAVAAGFDNFWATVGVHPDNEGVQEPTVQDLTSRAVHPKVIAVGETGLDYYRLGTRTIADMAWQRDRFAVHIQAARATQLPLVVHTRSASDDTLAVLKQEGQGMVRGVFHCFTETQAVARAALDLGFDISFSGILTFKNAADLRDVAKLVPMDRLLIETDSPFLAPAPHRGKTNQPAFVALVAEQVAQIKSLPLADVAAQTTRNFERLFGVTVPVPHAVA